VLEARDRTGGRICTDRSWSDAVIDVGASWIHGIGDSPVCRLARESQIAIRRTNYDSIPRTYTERGISVTANERFVLGETLERILDKIGATRSASDSLAHALKRAIAEESVSQEHETVLRHLINFEIEQDYAADVEDLSLRYWNEVDDFTSAHAIIPGGFDRIIDYLAHDIDVRLDHIVTGIEYDNQEVTVLTPRGAYVGDHAIVTVPLGVLKAGSIAFSPALPTRKALALERLRMGTLNKIFLGFAKCFWPRNRDWFEYVSNHPVMWPIFFNLFRYVKKPILTGFAVGAHGRRLEQMDDEAVIGEAMGVLRGAFGSNVPEPTSVRITRWTSDPFCYGSYCHIPPGASGEDCDALAAPICQRLFFAGEATNRSRYGTVCGALVSGNRAARIIALAHRKRHLIPRRIQAG
jgi:monoamine oxidase